MIVSKLTTNAIRFSTEDIVRLKSALEDYDLTGEEQVLEIVEFEGANGDKQVTYQVVLEATQA